MKRVHPVIIPRADLTALKTISDQVLKMDLSTRRKDSTEPLVVLSKFLHMEPKMEETTAIRKSRHIWKHLSYTFVLLLTYDEADVLENTSDLVTTRHVGSGGYVIVTTGSLEQWIAFMQLPDRLVEIKKELKAYFSNLGVISL